MELGQGTRQNLNAQRCTLSSIGFSVFSLCLYVLGFYKNPVVNKYSYFYGSQVKVKVKVALLSITLHVKTYKGIEKNVSHSPTVKHISAHAQQQIRQDI